jgi:acetyl esterase/lipase
MDVSENSYFLLGSIKNLCLLLSLFPPTSSQTVQKTAIANILCLAGSEILNASVRLLTRRQQWGENEKATARRARRLFGAPPVYQWLRTRGTSSHAVCEGSVRGEWVAPKSYNAGVILYLHGGGFVSCSAAKYRPVTAALARFASMRVFALDYRLAPEHRFPAAVDDVEASYRWLLEQGFLANQIALAGDSAGGGLVLSLLLRARDAGLPLPACAVCSSPWTDLAGTGESVQLNDGRCAAFRRENIAEFAAAYLGDADAFDPYASPAHADLSGLPPLLLQVGSTELLLDDARRVHEKIQAVQGNSQLQIYDDVAHGWQMLDGLVPEATDALRQAAEFIHKHTAIYQADLIDGKTTKVTFISDNDSISFNVEEAKIRLYHSKRRRLVLYADVGVHYVTRARFDEEYKRKH